MSLPVREQALAVVAARHALLPPVRILGRHDPLNGAQAIVQASRCLVKLVEKLLVTCRKRRAGLPFGYVVKDQPGKPDEQRYDRDQWDNIIVHKSLLPPCS